MNRFERDLLEALDGNEKEVLERRKKELDRIYSEGKACKNGYRRQCLAQEYKKKTFSKPFPGTKRRFWSEGKRSLTAFTAKAKPAKTGTSDSALHRNIKG